MSAIISTSNASAVPAHGGKPPHKRASIVFIDTQVAHSHPVFTPLGVEFDPSLDGYVASLRSRRGTAIDDDGSRMPARDALPETQAMRFWVHIFPDSMKKLEQDSEEPKGRSSSGYSIRTEKDWESVRRTLTKAREKYIDPSQGEGGKGKKNIFQRFLKKSYRKMADHSEQLKRFTQIGENVEYISPILAVIDILLDAALTASKVREQVLEAFDPGSIEDNFGDIEFFFSIFPDDAIIKEKSIDLVTAIFQGIEHAISFFITHFVPRGMKAVARGPDYQKALLESIETIQHCSDRLLKEGQKSDMYSSRARHQIITTYFQKLLEAIIISSQRMDHDRARMLTYLEKMLNDADKLLSRQMKAREERFNQQMEVREKMLEARERRMEEVEEERERRERRRERRERRREERERKRIERQDEIRRQNNTPSPLLLPVQATPPFPQQLTASHDPSSMLMPTAWQQLNLMSQMWAFPSGQQPLPQQPLPKPQPSLAEILGLLKVPELEKTDVRYILDKRYQVDTRSRGRAEAGFLSTTFRRWLTKPKSTELLVHGGWGDDCVGAEPSGVSLLAATLVQVLATREQYIPLAFFCGQHTDRDDEHVGGPAMVKSLIAQLLRQHDFTSFAGLNEEGIGLKQIRKGSVKTLCKLLSWLVRQLPGDLKVIYIIDQIGKYESDPQETKMLAVLETILGQVHDSGLSCTVKVMATSDEATDLVRDMFRDDDKCQLDLDMLDDECPDLDEYGSDSKLPSDDDDDDSDTTSSDEE